MKLLFFFLLMMLIGCQIEPGSPEAQLKDFVETRISNVVSREFIISKTTGKLKLIVENMSDEEFDKFCDLRQFKKESFKVHSRTCQDKKCFITYSIGIRKISDNQTQYLTEVKKIAELQITDGKWLISDVSNIKSYIESFETIDALKE